MTTKANLEVDQHHEEGQDLVSQSRRHILQAAWRIGKAPV